MAFDRCDSVRGLVAVAGLAVVLGMSAGLWAQPAPAKETQAQQAGKLWGEAWGQYQKQGWAQAGDLITQLLTKFPSYESSPEANVYLAACLLNQKKDDEFLKQINSTIAAFSGSELGLLASSLKLNYYLGKKDVDGFLDAWKESAGDGGRIPNYLLDPNAFGATSSNCGGLRGAFYRDLRDETMKLCSTPKAAAHALEVFEATFHQPPEKFPETWQWVHCYLLLVADKPADADKAFKQYTDWWAGDVRGRGLFWDYAEYLRTVAKKPEAAAGVYRSLIDTYGGTDTADKAGAQLAAILAADPSKTKDLLAWADGFIARHRLMDGANQVQGLVIEKCIALAAKDPGMAERAYKMLQQDLDKMPPPERVSRYESLVKLAISANDFDKAAEFATAMVGDDVWSGNAFNRLTALAGAYPTLGTIVRDAKVKRGIFDPPPRDTPPGNNAAASLKDAFAAAPLGEQFAAKLAANAGPDAEKIADDLVAKYPNTAAAVDSVCKLVEFYSKAGQAQPRDKWMAKAIELWPASPRSEDILNQRCALEKAAAQFDKLAADCDLGIKRFPSSQYRAGWVALRLECFQAAKDLAGAAAWQASQLNWSAMNGSLNSINEIVRTAVVPEGGNAAEVFGGKWADWGGKLGDTNAALACLANAQQQFLAAKAYDKAAAMAEKLRNQKVNPETAWRYKFSDIEMMLQQQMWKDAVAAAADRLPTEPRPQFRIYRQLDLHTLGMAFDHMDKLADAKTLSTKLLMLYKFPDDQDAALSLLIGACRTSKDPKEVGKAGEAMMRIARDMYPPDLGYTTAVQAAQLAQAPATYDGYLRQATQNMGRARYIVPKLLQAIGEYYLARNNLGQASSVQSQLASGFPASVARDQFDARIEAVRAALKAKPK